MKFTFLKRKKITRISRQEKVLTLLGAAIPYTLKVSRDAKHMRMSISRNATLQVTIPTFLSIQKAESLLQQKSSWILSTLNRYKSLPKPQSKAASYLEYQKHKNAAIKFVNQRIPELNSYYKLTYNKVNIKNHKTLWGSCSKKGNLNFNYRIILLPQKLADYIIVHELCHLQEFNHSKKFWDLVAITVPDHKLLRAELKQTGLYSQ